MAPPVALSRSDLLNWINSNFALDYQKIEQCGKGVVYCLIFDKLYPHTFNTAKIIKSPQNDNQVMQNYKLLQLGFNKRKLTRDVNVEKLMKCRLQDNLEFIQWLASQWLDIIGDIDSITSDRVTSSSRRSSMRPSRNSSAGTSIDNSRSPQPQPQPSIKPRLASNNPRSQPLPRQRIASSTVSKPDNEVLKLRSELRECKQQRDHLETEYKALEHTSDELNTERNFYLEKLRDIEALSLDVQESVIELTNTQLIESILEILYSTKEGFEVINENDYPDEGEDLSPLDQDAPNESVLDSPKSDSLMGIIPINIATESINPSNILDDDETF